MLDSGKLLLEMNLSARNVDQMFPGLIVKIAEEQVSLIMIAERILVVVVIQRIMFHVIGVMEREDIITVLDVRGKPNEDPTSQTRSSGHDQTQKTRIQHQRHRQGPGPIHKPGPQQDPESHRARSHQAC